MGHFLTFIRQVSILHCVCTQQKKESNREIKKTLPPSQVAENLSTPGTLISACQGIVTTMAAPIERKSACSAGELEEYEDVTGRYLAGGLWFCGGGDE